MTQRPDPKSVASALLRQPSIVPQVPRPPQMAANMSTQGLGPNGYTINALNGQISQWPSPAAAAQAAQQNLSLIHVTPQNIDNIPNMPTPLYQQLKGLLGR